MKIAGIIAEYNPFHNGHSYHLEETKRITGADAVVAVISGSVTQRGEVPLWNKWNRARMAVDNGVDLVLELPFAFAVNSAEEFARGGVSVLNSLGFVTDLVFGCEGDPDTVISMARRSAEREAEFQTAIRAGLEEGLSYPAARGKAMMQFLNEGESSESWEGESLDRPNDILAVEYVRQLVLQGSNMIPHGVKRLGSYHDDQVCESGSAKENRVFSSATAVRKAVEEGRWDEVKQAVPAKTLACLCDVKHQERFDSMILSHLWYLGPDGLREMYGCSEGLEYRIWNALSKAATVEELLQLVSSGRYSTARVRRLLIHAMTGLTKERFEAIKTAANEGTLFVRVLGCSQTGAKLLKQIKKSEEPPVILTNLNKELSEEQKNLVRGEKRMDGFAEADGRIAALALDLRAAEMAALARGERLYDNSDFVKSPYIAHKSEKNHK